MIVAKGLTKFYRAHKILEDVNLTIKRQEIVVLMGPSGAGKTSLAKILLGLEKPTSGSIEGINLLLSYLPQKISLNNYLNINSNTLFTYLAGKNLVDNDLFSLVINFANLQKIGNSRVNQLSGGELRRLLIASTLARTADFVVLDEPTQDLDIDSQQLLYQLLQKLRNTTVTSFLLISHDLYTVTRFADQVLCLNKHLCCFGRPESNIPNNLHPNLTSYRHVHDHQHDL